MPADVSSSRPAHRASTRSAVPPFAVMTVLNRVAELRAAGRDVISLCAGEPAQGAPTDVRRALADLMAGSDPLGYSEVFGIQAVRRAISGHYRRWYDLDVPPAQVAMTTGSSGAFLLGFLAAFDPGDRVAMSRPGYPAYRNILTALGCVVVDLACGPERNYRLDVDLVAAAHREAPLAGLVIASPANPTGTMVDADTLAALSRWCGDHGVRLVSDEIYHGITATGEPGSCGWEHDRNTVVVSSFSKFWGMTGWRLGWMLVPADLVEAVDALAGNFALCAPVPAQRAAVAAFTEQSYAEAETAVRDFAATRALVIAAAPDLGWTQVAPAEGAFYVYAQIDPAPYADSTAWCAALLAQQGVALTPGADFDPVGGGSAIRISLAAGPDLVAAALPRIRAFGA